MIFSIGGAFTLSGYGLLSGNETFYSKYAMPLAHQLMDGEQAHNCAILMAKYGLVPGHKKIQNENILVEFNFLRNMLNN